MMTKKQEAALADAVRRGGRAQWSPLLRLYEGEAHLVAGYSAWSDYAWKELDLEFSESYKKLDAARVERQLAAIQMDSDGLRQSHALKLHPLLRAGKTREFAEAARAVLAEGGWRAVTAAWITQLVFDRGWLVPPRGSSPPPATDSRPPTGSRASWWVQPQLLDGRTRLDMFDRVLRQLFIQPAFDSKSGKSIARMNGVERAELRALLGRLRDVADTVERTLDAEEAPKPGSDEAPEPVLAGVGGD